MKFKFDDSGIKKLQKNFKDLEGPHSIPFEELFTNSFMQRYTDFNNIESFVNKSSFDFNDMESINENDLDKFVNDNSTFSTWKTMLTKASQKWTATKFNQ